MPQYFCAQTRRAILTALLSSLMAGTGWRRIACVNEPCGTRILRVIHGRDARALCQTAPLPARSLFEIDQDHVTRLRATRERELFPIARESEPENALRSKI